MSIREAIEAAFCRAVRVTFVGSITPACTRSSYCSVEALKPKFGIGAGFDLSHYDRAFHSTIVHDLPDRLLASATHDGDAELLVSFELQPIERDRRSQKRNTAARHDAFFDGCASRMQSILDTGLLLFHFGLGSGAYFDDRHSAGQFRQPFLQLLAIIVRGGLFNLRRAVA